VCAVGLDPVVADVGLGEGAGGGGSWWRYGEEADVFAAGESVSGVSGDGALSIIVVSDIRSTYSYMKMSRFLEECSTAEVSRNVLVHRTPRQ
jgi:hypothetical protein